jgi:hypothetical protein
MLLWRMINEATIRISLSLSLSLIKSIFVHMHMRIKEGVKFYEKDSY